MVFRADPEVVELDEDGLGETSLTWETPAVPAVEIRVESPQGKLLGTGGTSGSIPTGHWVKETTRFYLVDPCTGDIWRRRGSACGSEDGVGRRRSLCPGGALGSREIEFEGRGALACYLVDATENQVLTTLLLQEGRG